MHQEKDKAQFFTMNFFIILFTGFVDYLGIGLVYPIFAVLLFDTSQSIVPVDSTPEYRGMMLGILIALTPISQFFFSPLFGAFSDLKGRRIALIFGVSVGCLGYLIAVIGIFLNSLVLLFVYRFLVGVSDATAAVAGATLVDMSTEENKAQRFAMLNSCLGLGFTLGPFLGGVIADPTVVSWFSYSTPFMAAGLLALTNLLLIVAKFPETRQIQHHEKFDLIEGIHNIAKIFTMTDLRWIFFSDFIFAFGWAFFGEFIPVFLQSRFHFDLSDIGQYYAYTGIWYAVGALLATGVVHRLAAEYILVFSLLAIAFCMIVVALMDEAFYIWVTVPFMMFFLALAYPTITTIVSNKTSKKCQGEVLGVLQSVGAAAMGLSPLFIGSAIGVYPSLAAWGGSLCFLIAAYGFWRGAKATAEYFPN